MARRIDFYDDPAAPAPNSLVPSVNVVVVNDPGEILLIRHTDNDNWALPGGAMDLGESLPAARRRRATSPARSAGSMSARSTPCRWTGRCGCGSATPSPDPRSRTLADAEWVNTGADVFSAVGTVGAFLVWFLLLRPALKRLRCDDALWDRRGTTSPTSSEPRA